MNDPYLNDLKNEFREYSSELKILKKNLLKSNSSEEQSKIIKKIDSIARDMEKNQTQSVRVTKSRLKEMSRSKKILEKNSPIAKETLKIMGFEITANGLQMTDEPIW